MKKLKAFGLIGIVLLIALMSVSSVWAGPLNGTVAPPPPKYSGQPDAASVGIDIDEDDLPEGFLAGKVVETDGETVTICFHVPNEYIGFLHKLTVKIQVAGRWVTIPSWGMSKNGEFYRCAEVTLGGTYYLAKP